MKRHLQTEKKRARDSKELPPQGGYMGRAESSERRGEGARTEVPQSDLRAENRLTRGWVTEGRQRLRLWI